MRIKTRRESKKKKKKRRSMMEMDKGLYQPPPDLPEEYKKMMNGAKAELVIQKQLFTSDMKPDQNRLSLPWQQILCKEFLRPNEIESLELPKTFLKVPLIDPKLGKEVISVSMWQMSSSEEKTVVLYSNWNYIVTKNGLVRGDLIQIWSFRNDEDRLQLALVVLKRAGKCENGVVAERAEKRENGVEGRTTAGSGSVSDVSEDSAGASHKGRTCMSENQIYM
ncbi:B3 domain-containing protein At3g25182-like [Argentina anserina]|uniref:B3 domain-containing protein At3g25182-like n=1 Tax=Argentina anserina TaxID=57926 RepID=UPI0021765E2D|nr:B3 domain-containing protein At3g25182-like [Potentilla anserina]